MTPPTVSVMIRGWDMRVGTTGQQVLDSARRAEAVGLDGVCAGDHVTFHGYGNPAEFSPIDWLLVSRHFAVQSAAVDTHHEGNLYPSDHYPITAEIDWQADGG